VLERTQTNENTKYPTACSAALLPVLSVSSLASVRGCCVRNRSARVGWLAGWLVGVDGFAWGGAQPGVGGLGSACVCAVSAMQYGPWPV